MMIDERSQFDSGPTPEAPPTGQRDALSSLNLLVDFAETADRLRIQLNRLGSREKVLDAFLLAAALNQILEDHLHRDVYSLGKVAKHIPRVAGPRTGQAAAIAARLLRALGLALRARRASERSLIGWRGQLAPLVERLAEAVIEGTTVLDIGAGQLAPVDGFPAGLRRTVARLPQCFRSFDQRPEDLARMVNSFAAERPDRTTALVVIGLRTAGSYLAPLLAASLKAEGYRSVEVLTLRPEQEWLEHELRMLAAARDQGSIVLIVDEPPRAGTQLMLAARQLEELGISRRSLVLFVPLFSATLPPALQSCETVPLPWEEWAIHDRLVPHAVRADLAALLPGWRIENVERVWPAALPASPRRGHIAALFRVALVGENSGEHLEELVCVEGVGLGYLGRHALAVAAPLADFLPRVHGVRDGLLYRAWLPEEWRQTGSEDRVLARRIASYVLARNRALAVPEDMTRRPVGGTVAVLVSDMLAEAFGRARLAVRPLAQRTTRRLLEAARPSVVDGSMALDHWFAPPGAASAARKVDFHQRAFSNEERSSYDPVYDLACAAASSTWPGLGEELLNAYEELSGDLVPPERWLLYQLLDRYSVRRRKAHEDGDIDRLLSAERAMVRAYQRYLASHFFSDLATPTAGALCAIDVDGVLEVRWLGFPAIPPAGALALRALACHGYRPVIATGRSLGEVQDRCRAYRLAGGVAEYGAAAYDHGSGRTISLLTSSDEAALAELRRVLSEIPNVHCDPTHRHSIRAYRLEESGTAGLDATTTEAALARVEARDQLRAIPAFSQTDFAVVGIDKRSGLRVLGDQLEEHRIVLAVGDTLEDLPMLQLAERPATPANADADLSRLIAAGGTGIEQAKRPSGAGLLGLVTQLVGHPRRCCSVCAAPRAPTTAGALLLAVLGALDGGGREKVRQSALLAARLAVSTEARRRTRLPRLPRSLGR